MLKNVRMKDVVNAIEKLSEKNIIDYLRIIVPIAISIVAIILSITTVRENGFIM